MHHAHPAGRSGTARRQPGPTFAMRRPLTKSNTSGRRAPNVPRASVTGGHRGSPTPLRPSSTAGVEASPKLILPCSRYFPARHDATAPSHRQPGSSQWHLAAVVACREPLDSLVMRSSPGDTPIQEQAVCCSRPVKTAGLHSGFSWSHLWSHSCKFSGVRSGLPSLGSGGTGPNRTGLIHQPQNSKSREGNPPRVQIPPPPPA